MLFNALLLRFFLLIILLSSSLLNAANYNKDILNIYSKMLPRFIIMSSQKEKINKNIEICIVHDSLDKRTAEFLSNSISNNYPEGLSSHPIKLIQSNYENMDSCRDVQLVFLFNSNDYHIEKALSFSQNKSILAMTYDMSYLQNGADISLFIGRKVVPYINIKAITNKKILLDNVLLRVSKIYKGDEK